MKNKIIILTPENFPYGGPGANFLRNLSLGLSVNSNFSIEVWLQTGNSRSFHNFEKKVDSIESVLFIFIGGFSARPAKKILKIFNDLIGVIMSFILLLENRKNIHSLFIYNCGSITSLLSIFICKTFKIQCIKIIPEWYDKKNVISSSFGYLKWLDFVINFKILNFLYDKLIVLSYFLKKFYVTNGYPENNIYILPNLVNLKEFSETTNECFKIEKNNKIIIGYSGSLTEKDGITDLLKAYSLLIKEYHNTELIIIGDISKTKSAIPYYKNLALSLGINDYKLRFTGLIDFKFVSLYLHSCDILVLARPSGITSEAGFPTKLGEYLACKKPVVLTKVGDIPKYFINKVNAILAESDNPTSIADGIKYLIENPLEAESIARLGYEWVLENLEYRKATAKLLKFINLPNT